MTSLVPPRPVPGYATYARRAGLLFVVLLASMALGSGLMSYARMVTPEVPLSGAALRFDAASALALTTELSTLFPNRADGHPHRAAAAAWLVQQLRVMGYEPHLHTFGAWIKGEYHSDLANVWAVRPGRSDEAVAVFAHYDVPPFAPGGAADDGSGVGSVLELARVFATENPARTVLFILTDTEDYGMAGARAFVSQKPYRGPIVAGVSLDFVNSGAPASVALGFNGTHRGYTPPWLRNLAFRAVSRFARPTAAGPLDEWIERTVAISSEDSGTFLSAGIPVLNLGVLAQDRAAAMAVFHTPDDTADLLHVEGFEWWGKAAELIVRSVTEQPSLPKGSAASMHYFGLSGDGSAASYLPGWALMAVQALLLAPLWVSAGAGWYRRWRGGLAPGPAEEPSHEPGQGFEGAKQGFEGAREGFDVARRVFAAQVCRLLAAATCLAAGLGAMKLMRLAGVVARYEVYPATSKDPYLYAPQAPPLVLAFAAMAAAWFIVSRFTRWFGGPDLAGAGWGKRHLALITVLAALTFIVWAEGAGCAAIAFFILPAYLWVLLPDCSNLTGRGRRAARAAGGLMVFLSAAVFMAFVYIFATSYYTGPLWWYLPLAATHGLISWKSSLVFLFSVALYWEVMAFAAGAPTRASGVSAAAAAGRDIAAMSSL